MKKLTAIGLFCFFALVLSSCGKSSDSNKEEKKSDYAQAADVLKAVADSYTQEERFAMYGGDQEHAVMDEPGKFDISKQEEMEDVLGLPTELASGIEDAASMVHMMNGNMFTGAAYRLKSSTDKDHFAQTVKDTLSKKQWICGQPDIMTVIDVDGVYVITAYGEAQIMETFKKKAMFVFKDAKVFIEAPIV